MTVLMFASAPAVFHYIWSEADAIKDLMTIYECDTGPVQKACMATATKTATRSQQSLQWQQTI